MVKERDCRSTGFFMGRPIGWSCSQYRGDLVLPHEKPERALLDDGNLLCPSGFADFPAGRHGSPFRGQISVGPEAFEMVYEQLMKAGK